MLKISFVFVSFFDFLNFSLGVILEIRWEQKFLTAATVPRCPHGIFTVAPRNRQFKRPPHADRKAGTYGFETCSQKVRSIIFGVFLCVFWCVFFSISAENVMCSMCCEYYNRRLFIGVKWLAHCWQRSISCPVPRGFR